MNGDDALISCKQNKNKGSDQLSAVQLLSRFSLPETPWTAAYQALPYMGFSKQEYWSGMPLPSPTST